GDVPGAPELVICVDCSSCASRSPRSSGTCYLCRLLILRVSHDNSEVNKLREFVRYRSFFSAALTASQCCCLRDSPYASTHRMQCRAARCLISVSCDRYGRSRMLLGWRGCPRAELWHPFGKTYPEPLP